MRFAVEIFEEASASFGLQKLALPEQAIAEQN
jgi:hypothetical protein